MANHAGLGHINTGGGGARNAFGSAFKDAGPSWTTAFCEADSDGDGQSNGEELGDPCCATANDAGNAVTAPYTNLITDPSVSSLTTSRTYCGVNKCGCTLTTVANVPSCNVANVPSVIGNTCTACLASNFSAPGGTACTNW